MDILIWGDHWKLETGINTQQGQLRWPGVVEMRVLAWGKSGPAMC